MVNLKFLQQHKHYLILIQPKTTNINAIIKKEKKFLSQNLRYALYENTEWSFCARWNPVNFCHTGLRAQKAPTHHASSTLSCWFRAIGSIALQSNYEGDLKGKFHIKHTTCTKLASSFQYWIGAQKSISGWKSGANYGHLKIMTMWNQSSKRKALLTVRDAKNDKYERASAIFRPKLS